MYLYFFKDDNALFRKRVVLLIWKKGKAIPVTGREGP
jgi:hypothetical protein